MRAFVIAGTLLLTSVLLAADAVALDKYVAAQEALAADDLGKAKAALGDLAANGPQDFRKLARAAADAKDLEATRKAFKPLSEAVAKQKLAAGLVVASCPMYEGGASWVQKAGDVKNPYYGTAMLGCGSIQKAK